MKALVKVVLILALMALPVRMAYPESLAEWTELTLTLYIRDKRGNTSDKVVFPLALTRGVKQEPPPPPFDRAGLKSLGTFWVKLFSPVE